MSKWAATYETFTPVGVSNATNFTDNGYWAILGGTATQRFDIYEVYLVGQSTSAGSMNSMVLARDGTVGATPTALSTIQSNGPLDSASAIPTSAPVAFSASGTKPQRSVSTTVAKLVMGFNPFGGVARWWVPAGSGAEIKCVGASTAGGEVSISATTIGSPGPMMATIQYELY
jgi:hypothetical protein